jgi:tripartite-type tricarboxylate transporter receptor subunit TctC
VKSTNQMSKTTIFAAKTAFAAALLGMTWTNAAQAVDYFAGKTITVEVPAGSGGTYHVYCQVVQNNLGRHIPGNPTMIIKNRPGAGGALSATFMAGVAPKDGTHIAMVTPGIITVPLFRKVSYDARNFNYLGSIAARSGALWIWHKKGITSIEQLKTTPVKIASTGYAAAGSVMPRLINKLLGTKMQLIYGYKGGGGMNLAIERGETEGLIAPALPASVRTGYRKGKSFRCWRPGRATPH